MKECRECEKSEPEVEFYKSRRTNVCKRCENAFRSARRTESYAARLEPDARKLYYRKHRLMNRYGISIEDYDDMLSEQGGACAVCLSTPEVDRLLCVDHSHDTGEVRGLLCDKCNRAAGHCGDDPELLEALAEYLRRY